MSSDIKIAVVCSSNQNRSMEAHHFLNKNGYLVKSFGIGSQVKLPGPSQNEPNIFSFETTYDHMFDELSKRDKALYTQNGVLNMLERNRRIKSKPERFQDSTDFFDIIVTVEERVYDVVLECLENRDNKMGHRPVHIINIDIQDNHEEATLGAFLICDLVSMVVRCDDIDNDIDEVIQHFSEHSNRHLLHTVSFY